MSGHTKEPWSYRRADGIDSPDSEDYKIFSADGAPVAETFELVGKHRATDQHANARRIVACVNSCAGIPDEKLESWLNPPEGQLGAPHGTWSQQLFEVGKQMIQLQREHNELLAALKESRRELHACQAVIHLAGGFDPAYVSGAQESLKKTDAIVAQAEAQS